ncbi:hypothetical protein [Mesorhizobium sp. IMUNJ 23232]|uniref:hypothetical protein n=1 Tax=Mesorhizobium sp. IMUNJ 23232 TaxID=3376064 RepID=UPI00379FE5C5
MPRSLERALLKPHSDTLFRRMTSAAMLRSASVLIRKHPRAAAHVVGAGLLQASRVGLTEAKDAVIDTAKAGVHALVTKG